MAEASLPDMMTAMTRAHAAGNPGDAAALARMIQTVYPDHTAALLSMAPGHAGFVNDPSQFRTVTDPSRGALIHPYDSGALPQPNLSTANAPQPQAGPPTGSAPPAAAPAQPAPTMIAPASSNWLGGLGQDIADFARTAVAQAPGNVVNRAITAPLSAAVNGTSYDQALANVNQTAAESAQRSPIASGAGAVYGQVAPLLTGGTLLGAAAKGVDTLASGATPVVSAVARFINPGAKLAVKGAEWAGQNPLKGGAAIGAGSAAFNDAMSGGSAGDVLTSAALGGVTGAAVGKGADMALTRLAPAAARGWGLIAGKMSDIARSGGLDGLADTLATQAVANGADQVAAQAAARTAVRSLSVDPEALAATHAQMTAANGGQPVPLAAAFQQYGTAQLKALAAKTPELGNDLATGAADWAAQGPRQVPELINSAVGDVPHVFSPSRAGGVQNVGDLEAARDAAFETSFNPIRGQHVQVGSDDLDALQHPAVQSVLSSNKAIRMRVNDAIEAATPEEGAAPAGDPEVDNIMRGWGMLRQPAGDTGATGSLALDDLDKIRRALGRRADSPDALVSEQAREGLAGIRDIATRNEDYGDALQTYGQHNAYIEGFKAGQTGSPLNQIPGAAATLRQPTGRAFAEGHASGLVSGLADKASASEAGARSVLQTLGQDNALRSNLEAAYGPAAADRLGNIGGQLSKANAAVKAATPGGPVGEAGGESVNSAILHAGTAAALGSHLGVTHNIVNALKGIFKPGALSPEVGAKLADMLSNPAQAQAAVALMRRQGVNDEALSRVVGIAAGLGGGRYGPALTRAAGGS